jgi:1-deoxy-D-xylulose-5-phosphate reductoisomerase
MGHKISIDSATMMNKALEIIEAHELFALPADKIDVLIHPQSIIHSMVEYVDGSILAQMGASDMRTPIAHTLGWPHRIISPGRKLDFTALGSLSFEPVDPQRFPSIGLAYEALKAGLAARIAFNAANEVAVAAFLGHKIAYLDIVNVVTDIMEQAASSSAPGTIEEVYAFDQAMRDAARSCIVGGNQPVRKVI